MMMSNKGLKMLIFAYHHAMMDALSEELHDNTVKYIRIDGSTPAMDRPVSYILDFQRVKIVNS